MGRFLITGSSAGLGLMAGQRLLVQGHQVVLHARNKERAEHAWAATPSASAVVIGDLSSIAETRDVADQGRPYGVNPAARSSLGAAPASPSRFPGPDSSTNTCW